MADYREQAATPVSGATDSTTAGEAIVTIPKSTRAAEAIYITKAVFSAKAAPGAAVTASIKRGATPVFSIDIPDAKFAPIALTFDAHPLKIVGEDAAVSMPSLGGGVQGTVSVSWFYGPA